MIPFLTLMGSPGGLNIPGELESGYTTAIRENTQSQGQGQPQGNREKRNPLNRVYLSTFVIRCIYR